MDPNRGNYPILISWARWLNDRPVTLGLLKQYSDERFAPNLGRLTAMSTIDKDSKLWKDFQAVKGGLAVAAKGDPNAVPAAVVGAFAQLSLDLSAEICALERMKAPPEKAQSADSPLGARVSPATDSDLLLASAEGVRGWQAAWGNGPIAVDINDRAVPEAVRVLIAFILTATDVVGMVFPADEAKKPDRDLEPAYADTLVADVRRPGERRRSVTTKNYGTMRSWHMDQAGFLWKCRGARADSVLSRSYLAANIDEFNNKLGIDPAADIGNVKGGPELVRPGGILVPQGLTEFNVLFGTNGRLLFDYRSGDFYLSGHYQAYDVPSDVLIQDEGPDGRKCFPYFKLVNPQQVCLTIDGYQELGRLRYWENLRRQGSGGTLQ